MTKYKNLGGDSGVDGYEYGDDWIRVRFKDGDVYVYKSSRIGAKHLNTMKTLADSGKGLNAYINVNHYVRDGWSSKN